MSRRCRSRSLIWHAGKITTASDLLGELRPWALAGEVSSPPDMPQRIVLDVVLYVSSATISHRN